MWKPIKPPQKGTKTMNKYYAALVFVCLLVGFLGASLS